MELKAVFSSLRESPCCIDPMATEIGVCGRSQGHVAMQKWRSEMNRRSVGQAVCLNAGEIDHENCSRREIIEV